MMIKRQAKSILARGAFFVVAATVSACGSGLPGNSVADVAGNPVTTAAFNHWMFIAAKGQSLQSPGAPVIVPTDPPNFTSCIASVRKQIPTLAKTSDSQLKSDCGRLFTSLSSQVMDFLIKTYWYQADAAAQHLKVTDQQIQQAFTTAKNQQFQTAAAFNQYLAQSGETLDDILFRFRASQIYMKLIATHPSTVTPAQIQTYYTAHQSQFGTPQTRNIRIILTKTQAQAHAAKAALSSGTSWKAAAKKYSIDSATKKSGGLLVGVTKGQEDAALDAAAFSAPANKLRGPLKAQLASGFYVFEVTKITKAIQQTLQQATAQITQTLTAQLRTSAASAVASHAKKAWLAKTQCRALYAMADCKGYKPPSTSTTAVPTPTPTVTAPSSSSTGATSTPTTTTH